MNLSIRYRLPGAGMVSIGDGLMAPGEYGITVDDRDLPYVLELDALIEDGKPVCQALRCIRRPGGPPVTTRGLRDVSVARILRHTLADVALRVKQTDKGYSLVPVHEGGDIASAYQAARRRYPVTDERLEEVARLYREGGAAPTKHVEHTLHVSRSTASRLVREARERGYLPERGKR